MFGIAGYINSYKHFIVVRVTGSFGKLCHIDRSLGLLHAVGEFDNDSVVVCMSF